MISLTTPVGRIVQGELWKAREVKDNKNVVKLNADGTPQVNYFFAIAIPKQPGHTHWAQTEWGRQIWDEGHRAHPNFAPHPTFSWKIEDGDSVIPNKKNKKNCDREGHPGHWILKFSSNFAITRTYNANGSEALPPETFKPGYYVQVRLSCQGNTGDTPGVYLNPVMVALSGYGPEIVTGPDVSEAGFGAAPLPPGASSMPPVGLPSAPPAAPNLPGVMPAPTHPNLPGMTPATPSLPGALPGAAPFAGPVTPPSLPMPSVAAAPVGPATTSPSSIPVVPNAAILAGPPAAPQMTAKAGGATYQQFIAQGWTDEMLRAQGFMQ